MRLFASICIGMALLFSATESVGAVLNERAAASEYVSLVEMASQLFPEMTRAERAMLVYADVANLNRGQFAVCGQSADPADQSNDPKDAANWTHDLVEVSFMERRGRGRPRKGEQVGLVNRREPWQPYNELHLYRLFYPIRRCLDAIADSAAGPPGAVEHAVPVTTFTDPDGAVSVFRGALNRFFDDLAETDTARIRRCPICARIYYAWRRDTGACSPRCRHTYNARNLRSAAKRRQYEETRQVNRLMGSRMPLKKRIPLNKAKAELQRKREKQRKPPNE